MHLLALQSSSVALWLRLHLISIKSNEIKSPPDIVSFLYGSGVPSVWRRKCKPLSLLHLSTVGNSEALVKAYLLKEICTNIRQCGKVAVHNASQNGCLRTRRTKHLHVFQAFKRCDSDSSKMLMCIFHITACNFLQDKKKIKSNWI